MGCDMCDTKQVGDTLVSIHAPAWGATACVTQSKLAIRWFQSTHPHGVRLLPSMVTLAKVLFQSTHPHGVRRLNLFIDRLPMSVSIHAPAWGATVVSPTCSFCACGFQSTHPHGVRLIHVFTCSTPTSFNPRTRMGCDLNTTIKYLFTIVSIHAPAWGATNLKQQNVFNIMFQSTHPHGVRLNLVVAFEDGKAFQSTHPHGVRPITRLQKDISRYVSIHAPAWGATNRRKTRAWSFTCFNPRTRMGCDRASVNAMVGDYVSIHAPAWGATLILFAPTCPTLFQSTHPHGVRLVPRYTGLKYHKFQSTHPHGVRQLTSWS